MKKVLWITISLFFSAHVSAATWNISNVLSGADAGFGFSSLHDSSGSNVMSGSILANITNASGTYDDVSGLVDFNFTLSNNTSFDLKGNLLFNNAGWLASNSTLAYTGLTVNGIPSSGVFGFMQGDVCCGGSYDPNSFMPISGGLNYLTLWGADGFSKTTGTYSGSQVGMDFRVELTPNPIPAAIWMFAPILGYLGTRKKKVSRIAG